MALALGGCATASPFRAGERAEHAQDYDRAVVEYTKAARANPDDRNTRLALERARLRASQEHYFRGRRLAAEEHPEDALLELQLASELNPAAAEIEAAVKDARQKLRTKLAASREGRT
jgi:tetratricopeptide (TPR) repeat protein